MSEEINEVIARLLNAYGESEKFIKQLYNIILERSKYGDYQYYCDYPLRWRVNTKKKEITQKIDIRYRYLLLEYEYEEYKKRNKRNFYCDALLYRLTDEYNLELDEYQKLSYIYSKLKKKLMAIN